MYFPITIINIDLLLVGCFCQPLNYKLHQCWETIRKTRKQTFNSWCCKNTILLFISFHTAKFVILDSKKKNNFLSSRFCPLPLALLCSLVTNFPPRRSSHLFVWLSPQPLSHPWPSAQIYLLIANQVLVSYYCGIQCGDVEYAKRWEEEMDDEHRADVFRVNCITSYFKCKCIIIEPEL